jgi:hypothetical protein
VAIDCIHRRKEALARRPMTCPPAPSTFDDLVRLIPPRGQLRSYRLVLDEKQFELRIGRNDLNIVFMSFCVPDGRNDFFPCVRTVESLTSQRDIWKHWQRFMSDPDEYLTFRRFAPGEQVHPAVEHPFSDHSRSRM